MGSTTHMLRPCPYLLQVTSWTLYFPVQNSTPHLFHPKNIRYFCNLTCCEGDAWLKALGKVFFTHQWPSYVCRHLVNFKIWYVFLGITIFDLTFLGGRGTLHQLKKIYQPHVIFKILGAPWISQHSPLRKTVMFIYASRQGGPGIWIPDQGLGGSTSPWKILLLRLKTAHWALNFALGSSDVLMQNPMFYRHILDLYLRYICFSFYFWGDQPMWRLCHFIALKLFPGLKYLITELILIFHHSYNVRMSFWRYVFPGITFWGLTYPFLGGRALKVLKKFYQPHVIFKILRPLCQ